MQKLGTITLAAALAVAACAGESEPDDVATDTTEHAVGSGSDDGATDTTAHAVEASDEAPPCTELFAPGQSTDQVLAAIGMDTTENMQTGGECADDEGEVSIHLLAYGTCASGARVWYLNGYGYGVEGGTWTPLPEGAPTPPTDC
jgi:hypothetical protein